MLIRPAIQIIGRHAPQILAGLAVIGVGVTAVQAAQGHLAAQEVRYELGESRGETLYNMLRARWKCYAPATITGILTIACVIGGTKVSLVRQASLVSALGFMKSSHERLQRSVEALPEEARNEVRSLAAKDSIAAGEPPSGALFVGNGDILWQDAFTGRYFTADKNRVDQAVNSVNHALIHGDAISLNEFYERVGLETVSSGDELGWAIGGPLVEVQTVAALSRDGRPCVSLDFITPPRPQWWKIG